MDAETSAAFARELRRQRDVLFKEVADMEGDLQFLSEDRESELEERGQRERAARLMAALDVRGKHEIEEIDAALQRIAAGSYGVCMQCGEVIPLARLQALPVSRYCIDCARQEEQRAVAPSAEELEVTHPEALPADLGLIGDREAEASLRELVNEDGRVDVEELRLVYRHGIVYLSGAVPSENEHQMLLKLLTDVGGIREIVDRLQVQEILWERAERMKAETEAAETAGVEPAETEDIVRSEEEGIEYVPPIAPPDEER